LFRESLQRGPAGSPEVPPATWGCRRRHWRRPQVWLQDRGVRSRRAPRRLQV